MAIPEGYEKLAVIGIAYKGDYVEGAAYHRLNAVYYDGSTYVAIRDAPVGPPTADGVNWQYLAKGFLEGVLSAVEAVDTSGVLGTAGTRVDAQDLIDALADRVMVKLIAKTQIVNNLLATTPGNVLDAVQGKNLKDQIDTLNLDFGKIGACYIKNFSHTKTGNGGETVVELSLPIGTYITVGYFRSDAVMTTPMSWWVLVSGGDYVGSNAAYNIAGLQCIGIMESVTSIHGAVIGLNAGVTVSGFVKAIRIR